MFLARFFIDFPQSLILFGLPCLSSNCNLEGSNASGFPQHGHMPLPLLFEPSFNLVLTE